MRYDIVLGFLALLELLRLRRIRVEQKKAHGAIRIFSLVVPES
jgi:chromatin segregation and condensation protein Rec8/ScpA/Scc1 (kleisin family)